MFFTNHSSQGDSSIFILTILFPTKGVIIGFTDGIVKLLHSSKKLYRSHIPFIKKWIFGGIHFRNHKKY